MTAPEEPDFSPSNARILCTDNVGLECKTWILMYSIGLCKDIFLQQIYDGEIMWNPITNEEVPEDSLWYFKPEWFNPTGKNKNKRKKEFKMKKSRISNNKSRIINYKVPIFKIYNNYNSY